MRRQLLGGVLLVLSLCLCGLWLVLQQQQKSGVRIKKENATCPRKKC